VSTVEAPAPQPHRNSTHLAPPPQPDKNTTHLAPPPQPDKNTTHFPNVSSSSVFAIMGEFLFLV